MVEHSPKIDIFILSPSYKIRIMMNPKAFVPGFLRIAGTLCNCLILFSLFFLLITLLIIYLRCCHLSYHSLLIENYSSCYNVFLSLFLSFQLINTLPIQCLKFSGLWSNLQQSFPPYLLSAFSYSSMVRVQTLSLLATWVQMSHLLFLYSYCPVQYSAPWHSEI